MRARPATTREAIRAKPNRAIRFRLREGAWPMQRTAIKDRVHALTI